jgi:hypothetical protein
MLPRERKTAELPTDTAPPTLLASVDEVDRSDRSAWPEVAPGLTPDSIQQKYPQNVVSTRIVPGCLQFLGDEKSFHTAWVKLRSLVARPAGLFYPQ